MRSAFKPMAFAALLALATSAVAHGQSNEQQPATVEESKEARPLQLPEVTVHGIISTPTTGPTATNSTTATRFDVNPRQIPQSIGVVSTELLEQIGARSAGDIAYLVSGVSRQAWDGWNSGLVVRGFEIQSNGLIDGLRQPRVSGRTSTTAIEDLALFERIEVLKGHSSVLYGRGWVGGTVNFITLKPQFNFQGAVDGLAGTKDDYLRGVVDLTGPVNESLAYRIIGVAQQHDFVKQDRKILAPSLLWKTPGGGTLHTSYWYSDVQFIEPWNAMLVNGRITPYQRFYELQYDDDIQTHDIKVNFEQPLAGTWKLLLQGAWSTKDRIQEQKSFASDNPFVTRGVRGTYFRQDRDEKGYAGRAEVQGAFALAGTRHRLLAGVERYDRDQDIVRTHAFQAFTPVTPLDRPAINTPNPAPLAVPQRFASDAIENAAYVADFIDIGQGWHVLAGARYSYFTTKDLVSGQTTLENSSVNPSLGVVYDFSPSLSGYISGGTSFEPNGGRDFAGNFFDPVRGRQFEVGVKGDAQNRRINYTLAAFTIKQDNVTTTDPLRPGFSALLGEVQVKGVEFDLSANLTPRLSVIGAVTYLDSEVVKSNTVVAGGSLQGKRLGATPTWSGALRLNYQASDAWRFGGVLTGVGDREGGDFSRFHVPNFVRLDLDASWRATRKLSFIANLENVFDTDYVASSFGPTQIALGKPINLTVRARYAF